MRIAHISDTHLGYKQYNLDEREDDFYQAFNEAIDKAIEERADILIHSGDLFNTYTPPIKALHTFKEALKKMDGKMKIFTILGEHDTPKRRAMVPHKLFDIPVLGIGELEYHEVNDVLVAGISNLKGILTEHLKSELRKFDDIAKNYKYSILIVHQGIKEHLPFEGAYELTEDDLPGKATYYAFGHIHSRIKKRFGNGFLCYSGSTEIVSRDQIREWERNGKGFYIVDLDNDVSVHSINLDIRPQVETEVSAEEINDLVKYTQLKKKPMLHITIKGESINRQQVIEKLEELLKGKVLEYRYYFKESKMREIEVSEGHINIKVILEEYLKDEELSKLAYELHERLGYDNDINGAINVAEKFMEAEDDNKEY